jgi:hypothetical protein
MPLPPKPSLPPAAQPVLGRRFDPWNSVSTGHQRADTSGPQGWRDSRTLKLNSQLRAGNAGGRRLWDTAGAGAADSTRETAAATATDMLRRPGIKQQPAAAAAQGSSSPYPVPLLDAARPHDEQLAEQRRAEDDAASARREEGSRERQQGRRIFDGVVVYVNGSTHPLVSDHRLKQVLAEHGGRVSIHLGRRQVTHVVLGRPTGAAGGAGGGLAGGKLEKEIRRVRGCAVQFVGVEW